MAGGAGTQGRAKDQQPLTAVECCEDSRFACWSAIRHACRLGRGDIIGARFALSRR
jgi:hypothetical protein